jgi:hypothetical protein
MNYYLPRLAFISTPSPPSLPLYEVCISPIPQLLTAFAAVQRGRPRRQVQLSGRSRRTRFIRLCDGEIGVLGSEWRGGGTEVGGWAWEREREWERGRGGEGCGKWYLCVRVAWVDCGWVLDVGCIHVVDG